MHCLTLIPLLSIPPLAALIIAMREGAPRHPALTGALAGAAAAGVAATIYATNCTDDSPLFVASWYPLATLIVVAAGALAGRDGCSGEGVVGVGVRHLRRSPSAVA